MKKPLTLLLVLLLTLLALPAWIESLNIPAMAAPHALVIKKGIFYQDAAIRPYLLGA